MSIVKKIAASFLAVILCSCFAGCNAVNDSLEYNGGDFTCLGYTNVFDVEILVHEQTGVMYLYKLGGSLSPMIKADGTAYTIEDYKRDCKEKRKDDTYVNREES